MRSGQHKLSCADSSESTLRVCLVVFSYGSCGLQVVILPAAFASCEVVCFRCLCQRMMDTAHRECCFPLLRVREARRVSEFAVRFKINLRCYKDCNPLLWVDLCVFFSWAKRRVVGLGARGVFRYVDRIEVEDSLHNLRIGCTLPTSSPSHSPITAYSFPI